MTESKPFALVTAASSGIGLELARELANRGYDLLLVADEPALSEAAATVREANVEVSTVEADLSTMTGIDRVLHRAAGRPLDVLVASGMRRLDGALLDQNFDDIGRVLNTNISGIVYLVHQVANQMRSRDSGHILIVGLIDGEAGQSAVYTATEAFMDSFLSSLSSEFAETGIGIARVMLDAPQTKSSTKSKLVGGAIEVLDGLLREGNRVDR